MTPLIRRASRSEEDETENTTPKSRVSLAHRQAFNFSADSTAQAGSDADTQISGQNAGSTNDTIISSAIISGELEQIRGRLHRRSTRLRTHLDRVRARFLSVTRPRVDSVSSELANEHKATRVLAVVFACFFTCWTPFFINNLTVGFCGVQCAVPPWVESVILWLGYLSSILNPIIYTVCAREYLMSIFCWFRSSTCAFEMPFFEFFAFNASNRKQTAMHEHTQGKQLTVIGELAETA